MRAIASLELSDEQTSTHARLWHAHLRRRRALDLKFCAALSRINHLLPPPEGIAVAMSLVQQHLTPTHNCALGDNKGSLVDQVLKASSSPTCPHGTPAHMHVDADEGEEDENVGFKVGYGIFTGPEAVHPTSGFVSSSIVFEDPHADCKDADTDSSGKMEPRPILECPSSRKLPPVGPQAPVATTRTAQLLQTIEGARAECASMSQHAADCAARQHAGAAVSAAEPLPLKPLHAQHSRLHTVATHKGQDEGQFQGKLLGQSGACMRQLEDAVAELQQCSRSDFAVIISGHTLSHLTPVSLFIFVSYFSYLLQRKSLTPVRRLYPPPHCSTHLSHMQK